MNFLVVGFGGMGCRHAQSILSAGLTSRVSVVDSSADVFNTNLNRIGYTFNEVIYCKDIESVPDKIDVAIVATSAGPRFEIVKKLVERGVKIFLLEKVLFQSDDQFKEIIQLLDGNQCQAFCNLPNRYFTNYVELRNKVAALKPGKISMNVIGGEFGLACNTIHYADLFEYLIGEKIVITNSNLVVAEKGNKRGSQYKELIGTLSFKSLISSHQLNVCSNLGFEGGVVVDIRINDESFLFFENSNIEYFFSEKNIGSKEFILTPSSKLTSQIITDILDGKCKLPDVKENYSLHKELFSAFNPVFGLPLSSQTVCPIT